MMSYLAVYACGFFTPLAIIAGLCVWYGAFDDKKHDTP